MKTRMIYTKELHMLIKEGNNNWSWIINEI